MLKFLLITLLVVYLFFQFSGYLLRLALWFTGRKLQKKMKEEREKAQGFSSTEKNGLKIIIPEEKGKKKRKSFGGGDYVAFEEVNPK